MELKSYECDICKTRTAEKTHPHSSKVMHGLSFYYGGGAPLSFDVCYDCWDSALGDFDGHNKMLSHVMTMIAEIFPLIKSNRYLDGRNVKDFLMEKQTN